MAWFEQLLHRRRWLWWLTALGFLVVAGLLLLPVIAGEPRGDALPDGVRFIGHFHPVLLHLPIGVFVLIVAQELKWIFCRKSVHAEHRSGWFALIFATVSAVFAAIVGFLLYYATDDYADNDLVQRHLWGGMMFAAAAVMTLIGKAWTVAASWNPWVYRVMLFGAVAVMGIASHDGASITHGKGYLTRYAPEPIHSWGGGQQQEARVPEESRVGQVVYADYVQPIFERTCVECHKEGKAKGKYRMDTYDLLVKGGKEGPGLVPGSAAKSNIVTRMELPTDDEEHMPPEGKPDLTDDELAVIRWWIDSGADPIKRIDESEVPAPVMAALTQIAKTHADTSSQGGGK